MPGPARRPIRRAASSRARVCTASLNWLVGIQPIDESPLDRAFAFDAFDQRAEEVREVAAHVALVDDAREAAGAGQDAEQRRLRQAHRRIAVVDEHNLVAGERELVAAAGADAVQRGQELQSRMRARILDRQPRFVGELAEVHLRAVRRSAQHHDVGAGAEDALLQRADDDGVDFGMLEAKALDRVGELDVDAEVVGIELELVVGREAGVFADVHRQRGDRAVEGQLPVVVAVGGGVKSDH